VWRRIGDNDLIDKALDGFNVTILAYRQTGSGKTYTMFGPEILSHEDGKQACLDPDKKHYGLIPRALSQLFDILNRRKNYEQGTFFCISDSE